ncbi:11789_t:CDS:1, partial [Acaulospora colombiana]
TDLLRVDNGNEREQRSEGGRELHGENAKRTVLGFYQVSWEVSEQETWRLGGDFIGGKRYDGRRAPGE